MWCENCTKRRIASYGKAFHKNLCSYCAYGKGGWLLVVRKDGKRSLSSITKIRQSMIKSGGELPREQRFKPLLHIGIRLRGSKFADWVNEYCKENL